MHSLILTCGLLIHPKAYSADHNVSFDSCLEHSISYLIDDTLQVDIGYDRYLTDGRDGLTDDRVYRKLMCYIGSIRMLVLGWKSILFM